MTDAEPREPLLTVIGYSVAAGTIMGCAFAGMVVAFDAGALWLANHHILHKTTRMGIYSQVSWFDLALGFSAICSVLFTGVALKERFKEHGWGMFVMPAWIWPKTLKPETTVAVRFGRVVHWTFVVIAVAILAFGLLISEHDYSTNLERAQEQAQWDQTHIVDTQTGRAVNKNANVNPYLDPPRPIVYDFDWSMPLAFAIAAGIAGLIGRGIRYIIAGE